MKKKPMTAKQVRKSIISRLSVAATLVHNFVTGFSGICGIHPYLDRRKNMLHYMPGVQLQPWKFMELFGEDTNYEYLEDKDGDKTLYAEVNGVVFHALIHGMDVIVDGRLA